MEQLDVLLQKEPDNPLFWDLRAAACAKTGEYEEALNCRRKLVEDFPDSAKIWLAYGHALRAVGFSQPCIAAFRKAIEISPSFGEAYWALANLKTFRFTGEDMRQMQATLARPDLSAEDRAPLHYALGKAQGDLENWSKSFENYAKANGIMRLGIAWDPDYNSSRVSNLKTNFTREFFRERSGVGCSASDPIFVVGMQRAGSTLVEQILASHSAIEGAGELTDIAFLAGQIPDCGAESRASENPVVIGKLDAAFLRRLGERYLESTRHRRKLGRPFFTDKQPYNFWHIGLIQLILPNARIIDVRRHPLACCFSNFSHHYASRSRTFTHRLADLGRYYRDYVELMAHFDDVLPGRIYRMIYEKLIETPEAEIRRMFGYLGLSFEPQCMEFHKNVRKIDSASSEQVRIPIFHDGVEHWRHYEPWLAPLKAGIGPLLDAYPNVPAFAV